MINKYYNNLLFMILIIGLFSCHPTERLMIFDGKNIFDNYIFKENNLFSVSIRADYTISTQISLYIKVMNNSDSIIYYHTKNLELETKVLSFKDRLTTVVIDTIIKTFRNKSFDIFIIKPHSSLSFDILYIGDVENLSVEQKSDLWPWPKSEKINLNLGEIRISDKTFKLKTVDIIHN